jgi:hypothetical protein
MLAGLRLSTSIHVVDEFFGDAKIESVNRVIWTGQCALPASCNFQTSATFPQKARAPPAGT